MFPAEVNCFLVTKVDIINVYF